MNKPFLIFVLSDCDYILFDREYNIFFHGSGIREHAERELHQGVRFMAQASGRFDHISGFNKT
jgi:hypothetical protein